ncbi:hypothetical protein TTHERM_000290879 (macronuclear) [Tetrahymena thermophila SB210]|uniref:Uncharacterized protein n=1 Tax=Tetrahymena thermophila (strain SB210) TaxID=312017 RepID=W7XJ03_TETTS|nr:hypothetical protein TTHERM_000290879 [Tetrahymena thermophila SB210]EWS73759.1 hypothetical protein TTHERM_000290879 [Tetrahymena thermophila SB210]|eukprot:XP_012653723.1 hypothetical protein TTHERM_000290879 [Tetrahymena thermophila SB210]
MKNIQSFINKLIDLQLFQESSENQNTFQILNKILKNFFIKQNNNYLICCKRLVIFLDIKICIKQFNSLCKKQERIEEKDTFERINNQSIERQKNSYFNKQF